MGVRTWLRIGSLCWIGYLVLALTGFALLPKPMPGTSAAPSVIAAYFAAHGSAIRAFAVLDDLANLFLLVFWVYLASQLAGSDGRSPRVAGSSPWMKYAGSMRLRIPSRPAA